MAKRSENAGIFFTKLQAMKYSLNCFSESYNEKFMLSVIGLTFCVFFSGSGWLKIKPDYLDSLSDQVNFVLFINFLKHILME